MSDETEIIVILETDDDGNEYYYNNKDKSLTQKAKPLKAEWTRKPKRIKNIDEKRKLAEIIQQERAIWDVLDDAYKKPAERTDAWLRVAEKMPNRTVPELKLMWTSLQHTARRKKRTSAGDFELRDCLEFYLEDVSSRAKQRSNTLDSSEARISVNNSQQFGESASSDANQSMDYEEECDTAESGRDPLKPMPRVDATTPPGIQSNINRPPLKYGFVWQYLEHLYSKLNHKEIEELNVEFINLVYDKIRSKQTAAQRR